MGLQGGGASCRGRATAGEHSMLAQMRKDDYRVDF